MLSNEKVQRKPRNAYSRKGGERSSRGDPIK